MSTPGRWTDDHFIAGDVALDFANTIYRRTPELGPDLLNSAEELVGWFVHAGLLTAVDGGSSAHVDLEETLQDTGHCGDCFGHSSKRRSMAATCLWKRWPGS